MKGCQATYLQYHTDVYIPKAVDLQLTQRALHCSRQMLAKDGQLLLRRIWEHEQRQNGVCY
jgi:hypothetical protein